jgi:hypothetical protein
VYDRWSIGTNQKRETHETALHRAWRTCVEPILWEYKDLHSVEYFTLTMQDSPFILAGTVVLLLDQQPTRVVYTVECDQQWRTRNVVVHQERAGEAKHLAVRVGDQQTWQADDGSLSFATGLYDIDLQVTPATNLLPIRRLDLKVGESQPVEAVWVRFPGLTLERLQQRYTRIDDRCYQYESSTGFVAQLVVDTFGLVVDYGDLWHRVT